MKFLCFFTLLFAIGLTAFAESTISKEEESARRLKQGVQYFDSGKYDLAETEFKAILDFTPNSPLAYFNLGLTKYKQGHYPEAIKNFDKVIQMRSDYTGAALYFKAISQMNLDQTEEAIKTAKRHTQARFFVKDLKALVNTIQTGSDEYFENAKLAAADENYELCLLEMDQSALTDTRKGKELVNKCTLGLKVSPSKDIEVAKAYYYSLYLDAHVSQTDNIYQENTNILKKLTYFTEIGGEFVLRNKIDTGIGLSYNQFNAIELPRFKDETYNIYIPFYYKNNNNYFGTKAFFNNNKYEGLDSYSDTGLSFFYSHLEKKKYLLSFYVSTLARTSFKSDFDYKAGTNNFARLYGSRFINELTVSASIAYEQTHTGDQPWGAFILPYANKTMSYGLSFKYDFDKISSLNLRSNYSVKDYSNKLSPNNIYRNDKFTGLSLIYQHIFNKKVKAYLQQSMNKNISNYDDTEFINRNYTENMTIIGMSLVTY